MSIGEIIPTPHKLLPCNFCGKARLASIMGRWDIFNSNEESIFCCRHCALDVVPRLMAGALRPSCRSRHDVEALLKQAEGAFWKELFILLNVEEKVREQHVAQSGQTK